MVRIVALILVLTLGLGAGSALAQDSTPVESGAILQAIRDRGTLVCGVNNLVPGLGFFNPRTGYSGLDISVCQAVAAAILGNPDAVEYVPLTAGEREEALNSGRVDMISRNTTLQLTRDTLWNATFGPVVLYDGQGIMTRSEDGLDTLESLAGKRVCSIEGTASTGNFRAEMEARGLAFEEVTFPDLQVVLANLFQENCDAVTSDASQLQASRAFFPDPRYATIPPLRFTEEPLAPLSLQSDPAFALVIQWVVYGLIRAEELGITSENVDTLSTSAAPEILRFLGHSGDAGTQLGLAPDFMATVIRSVGNYGEIFERTLGPNTIVGLERGINALWSDGGLMYAPSFN